MKSRHLIFIPFILLLLSACNTTSKELRTADKLMEYDPDSSLYILQHLNTENMSDANQALYGLLYFQALDCTNKPLGHDSVIDFSLNYFRNQEDNLHLAVCYFYKAKLSKTSQRFDDATLLYLKALDLTSIKKENYLLLGKIYSDMGDICAIQMDFSESLRKFQKSIFYFNKAENRIEACYRIIALGRVYRFLKKHKIAQHYYQLALSETSDSLIRGMVFQEVGINYYWSKQYDSAQIYLKKSLKYPYKGTNYAIRCVNLSDLFFDKDEFDSSFYYANMALKYPNTFYNQRDCYRILVNTEYNRGNLKSMVVFMSRYQDCSDSVRKIESQTKSSVLEHLHKTEQEASGTKRNSIWIISVILLVLLSISIVTYRLYHRNKLRKSQLDVFKQELNQKREFVTQSISNKIEELRLQQAEIRHNASAQERIRLDKELYEKSLHVGNWEVFSCEMNHAFNQLVDRLQSDYSGITQKEICWCCLHLLNIPLADRLLILDATTDSMYKLKQRLAQKMNLKSTRELDAFLQKFVTPQD